MGVHGLWRLIEPSGKPVPLETLENKVLAVDVSIWLHQAIKGFHDSRGAPIPNAHLLGIYHRVCKLLYFKIKPIFVFDGGVPALKKETIAKRNQSRSKVLSEADRIQKQLIETLLKHTALNKVLAEKIESATSSTESKQPKNSRFDMYMLPESSEIESSFSTVDDESMESTEDSSGSSPGKHLDLHTIDMESVHFKSLPADVRHEILTDLKETRKQSSWGRLHELPKQSDEFATYQIRRLLKRQAVQDALESAEKEMGGHSLSLAELEAILRDQGVIEKDNVGNRIASDENKRYLYIKDIQQAIIEQKNIEPKSNVKQLSSSTKDIDVAEQVTSTSELIETNETKTIADKEFEQDLEKAIAISLQESSTSNTINLSDIPSTSKESLSDDENLQTAIEMSLESVKNTKQKCSFLQDITGVDFNSGSSEDETEVVQTVASAKNYMMEYSGLTPNEIAKIINSNNAKKVNKKETIIKENIVESTTVSTDEKDFEEVEIMSASSESSSNDFVEVTSNDQSDDNKNVLEIIVDVQGKVEDDLFSDIFEKSNEIEEKAQEQREETSQNDSNTENDKSVVAVQKDVEVTKKKKQKISVEELEEMRKELQQEENDLLVERSTKERMAGNITDQMVQEAQELLELFGVPYIVAPMEAEAQCAFLDRANLTDGTITDDSDVWLFGGNTVYKNFFNQSKYVAEFRAENIRHDFKLTREQMILLALLVGSDYTVGIRGVGPVTALEILAAFPPSKGKINEILTGLQEFRSWFAKGKAPGPGRTSLRSKLKNVSFLDNFPSLKVVQAYLEPTVETSREEFSWGKPNVGGLAQFAREKFGWTRKKSEEILTPVLHRLADSKTQKTIKDFFRTVYKTDVGISDKQVSKRVRTAIDNMGKDPSEIITEDVKKELKSKKFRKQKIEVSSEKSKEASNSVRKKSAPKEEKGKAEIDSKKVSKNPRKCSRKVEVSTNIEGEQQPSTSKEDPSNDVLDKIQKIRTRRRINTAKAKILEKEKLEKPEKKIPERISEPPSSEELFLTRLTVESEKRVSEIESQVRMEIDGNLNKPTPSKSAYFRRGPKETIPQKERNKSELLRNKLKAIEVFRKSKRGPGYVGKRNAGKRLPKKDAGLSESSSDE